MAKILVIDDEPSIINLISAYLKAEGYEIHTATDAAEALAILKRGTPIDILFTDIVMPNGMNGIELAREARQLRPEIRVLLASGYSRERLEARDDMAFIAKPYKMADLARHLEAITTTR